MMVNGKQKGVISLHIKFTAKGAIKVGAGRQGHARWEAAPASSPAPGGACVPAPASWPGAA
jgi:hypothetical protein